MGVKSGAICMGLMYSILQCQQNNMAVSSALCTCALLGCCWCSACSSSPAVTRVNVETPKRS